MHKCAHCFIRCRKAPVATKVELTLNSAGWKEKDKSDFAAPFCHSHCTYTHIRAWVNMGKGC